MKQVSGQMSLFDLDMPCGKMFPEHSAATKEKISELSSKSFVKSKTKQPMFLDLRKENGTLVGASWGMGIPSRGECLMRDFGESPSEEEESGLSQILEANVPLKYYLSARACEGVLRRAERRGKELKPILKLALEQQIERWRKYGSPLPVFEGEGVIAECYDARGNGDGKVVPTITGDHNNRLIDYTALVCEKFAENSSGDGISGTIDASYYKGVGSREGKEREFVVCEMLGFNPLNGAKAASNAEVENGSPTLRSSSPTACVICFSQDAYDKYKEAQHAASLKASGGNYGGGSENLVCAGFSAQSSAEAGLTFNENLSPTLQVGKCAAVVTEHHTHEEVVRMREGKDGGGKGALVQEDKSGTIACNNDQVLFQHTQTQYVVRRLTPLECCRLQGMPDFWTDGVEGSDAARYKLWGNGMALPNALYILEGI